MSFLSAFFETQNFGCKVFLAGENCVFLLFRRGVYRLHPLAELCRLFDQAFEELQIHSSVKVVFDFDDQILWSLQEIGGYFSGYVVEDSNGELDFSPLGGKSIKWAVVGPHEGFEQSKSPRFSCCVLRPDFKFLSSVRALEYVENCRVQESYPLGRVQIQEVEPEQTQKEAWFTKQPSAVKRVLSDFEAVLKSRRSGGFERVPMAAPSKAAILGVLGDSLFSRQVNKFPVASAGNLFDFKIVLVLRTKTSQADQVEIYSPLGLSEAWSEAEIFENTYAASGAGDCYRYAEVLGFIVADVRRATFRYGNRGLRFLTLSAGGILQQLHLSSTSYGLGFRALGGFDEQVITDLLKLSAVDFVACGFAIGAER